MLSNRLIQTIAACAATVALVSSAPAFAAQGSTRSAAKPRNLAVGHHAAAKGPLVHATGFNGATLDPNGSTVDGLSLIPGGTNGAVNVSHSTPRPEGSGVLVDPNG